MKSRSQEPPGYPDIWPCRARIPLPALLLAARPLNRLLRPLLAQPRPLPVSALPVLVPIVLSMTPYPCCFCQLHVATINSITAIACEQRSGKALSPPSGTRLPFFSLVIISAVRLRPSCHARACRLLCVLCQSSCGGGVPPVFIHCATIAGDVTTSLMWYGPKRVDARPPPTCRSLQIACTHYVQVRSTPLHR